MTEVNSFLFRCINVNVFGVFKDLFAVTVRCLMAYYNVIITIICEPLKGGCLFIHINYYNVLKTSVSIYVCTYI